MGAAEDGRAPTEELLCVRAWDLCWTGAAEDDRAPTEELSCVGDGGFCSTGRSRSIIDWRRWCLRRLNVANRLTSQLLHQRLKPWQIQ